MTFWDLAAMKVQDIRIDWESQKGVVTVHADGLTVYLAELLAVPHSPLWDFVRDRACR